MTVPRKQISASEINELPVVELHHHVRLASDPASAREALQLLDRSVPLGFDTETKPQFKPGPMAAPCLLQLADEKTVVVLQLKFLRPWTAWLEILEAPTAKVGVAIADDLKGLRRWDPNFAPLNFVEIARLARQKGFQQTGLRSLAAMLLKVRVPKTVQVSNWARRDLSDAQIRYAALDAVLSRDCWKALMALPDEPLKKPKAAPNGEKNPVDL